MRKKHIQKKNNKQSTNKQTSMNSTNYVQQYNIFFPLVCLSRTSCIDSRSAVFIEKNSSVCHEYERKLSLKCTRRNCRCSVLPFNLERKKKQTKLIDLTHVKTD